MAETISARGRGRPPKVGDKPEGSNVIAGPGHNVRREKISDDDMRDLFRAHVYKIRGGLAKVAELAAKTKEAREEVNSLCMLAKGDNPKWLRKRIMARISEMDSDRRDLADEQVETSWEQATLGLDVGVQIDMFKDAPGESKDEAHWRGAGYVAGQRAGDAEPPKECAPRFRAAYQEGWNDGQAVVVRSWKTVEKMNAKPEPEKPAPKPKTAKQEEAAAKAALDAIGRNAAPEGFDEATPEELAAQANRSVADEVV